MTLLAAYMFQLIKYLVAKDQAYIVCVSMTSHTLEKMHEPMRFFTFMELLE